MTVIKNNHVYYLCDNEDGTVNLFAYINNKEYILKRCYPNSCDLGEFVTDSNPAEVELFIEENNDTA